MKLVSLPSGNIIDIEKIAFIHPAKEKAPGIRYSFGANFNELALHDALAVLDALEAASGIDTRLLRERAGLPSKS